MKIRELKAMLEAYDNNDKGKTRRIFGVLNVDRKEISSLRKFIAKLNHDKDSEVKIGYDVFETYLYNEGKRGLISNSYLESKVASTKIFLAWKKAGPGDPAIPVAKRPPLPVETEGEEMVPELTPPSEEVEVEEILPVEECTSAPNEMPNCYNLDLMTYFPPDITLVAAEIFLGENTPDPRHYRLQVFNLGGLSNGKIILIPTLDNTPRVLQDEIVDRIKTTTPTLTSLYDYRAYARADIQLYTDQWTPLPAIHGYTQLSAMKSDYPIELAYRDDVELYYARLVTYEFSPPPRPKVVRIEYNVDGKAASPPNKNHGFIDNFPTSPEALNFVMQIRFDHKIAKLENIPAEFTYSRIIGALIDYLKSFKAGKLKDVDENTPYYSVINAMLEQQLGTSHQRAALFMILANCLAINARMVMNHLQAFVEVAIADNWYGVDLGEAPVKTKIVPLEICQSDQSESTPSPFM